MAQALDESRRAEVLDEFSTGIINGPSGQTRSMKFVIRVRSAYNPGHMGSLTLSTPEEIAAFAEWVKGSAAYIDDIAQEAMAWMYQDQQQDQQDA